MDERSNTNLPEPRLQDGRELLIAGLKRRFTTEGIGDIPALWQRFSQHFNALPSQVSSVAYGVCFNTDDAGGFDYVAGVEVSELTSLPADLDHVRIPERPYAVFTHSGHISTLRATFIAIFNDWLPKSGHRIADAPNFERYDERFDARTGLGGLEIWIPLKS